MKSLNKTITWFFNFGEWLRESFVVFALMAVGVVVVVAIIAASVKPTDGFTTRGLRKTVLRAFVTGVIMGRIRFTPLRVQSPERQQGHILIIGTPGSAKTTGFYLPTFRA